MAAKKRKKQSKFRFGLHIYSSLLVFVAGIALIVLWIFLSRYQQGVDAEAAAQAERDRQAAYELAVSRAPQKAFEDYVASADAQRWADSWYASNPANYDDPAQVLALMQERFSDPDLKYWKAEDSTDAHPSYIIKSGDETIAELTLSGSGLDWSVSDVKVELEGGEEASLLVPEGYAVYCNGQPVDSSSAEAETRLFDMEEYADLIVDPVHWETYTVRGQLTKPVLTAEAPADRPISTAEDGTVFYVLTGEEAEGYQQRAENFIYALLYYYMLGNSNTRGHMWNALNHVMPDSQAYQLILDSYDGVTWDTCYGNATYDAEAGEVRIIAGNCLMVDVSYHAEGSAAGYTNVADGTYRVYFLDKGNGYGIFGLAYV